MSLDARKPDLIVCKQKGVDQLVHPRGLMEKIKTLFLDEKQLIYFFELFPFANLGIEIL